MGERKRWHSLSSFMKHLFILHYFHVSVRRSLRSQAEPVSTSPHPPTQAGGPTPARALQPRRGQPPPSAGGGGGRHLCQMAPPRGQEQRLIEEVRRLRNELGRERRGHPRGPLLVAAGGVLLAPLLLAVSLVRGRGARRKALEEAARALEQATQMREEAVALQAEIMGIVARTQEAVQAKVEREAAVYLREQEMRVGRRVEEIEERADERAKESAARTKQVLEAEAAEQKRELQTAFAAESKRLQREVFDLWEKAERISEKSQRAERAAAEAAEQLRGLGSAAQPAIQAKKLADEAGVLNRQCLDELDAFNNARVRMDVAQLDPDDVKARLLALKIHSSAVRTVENLLRARAETAAAEAAGGAKKAEKVVAVLRVRRSGGGAGQAPTASPRQLICIEEGAVLTVAEPDPRRRTRQPYSRGAVEGGGGGGRRSPHYVAGALRSTRCSTPRSPRRARRVCTRGTSLASLMPSCRAGTGPCSPPARPGPARRTR